MTKRGPKFKVATPEDMDRLIDEHLDHCAENAKPVTLTGFLLHMGIYSRDTLGQYERREGFGGPVKRLRSIVENAYEQRLHGNNPTGAIFALKNMGWRDTQNLEHSGKDGGPIEAIRRVITDPRETQDAHVNAANGDAGYTDSARVPAAARRRPI